MPPTHAVLFDLDDTLYEELSYVQSGFHAVAEYLSGEYGISADGAFADMMDVLAREGRGRIFDRVMDRRNLRATDLIPKLVQVYRDHLPSIVPFPDVLPAIDRLRRLGVKLGLITDGQAQVQERKVVALGLHQVMDVIIYTGRRGPEYWKPNLGPFLDAARALAITPIQAAYVGNDPAKDFVGANRASMLTIHLLRRAEEEAPVCDAAVHATSMHGVVEEIERRREAGHNDSSPGPDVWTES